MQVGVDILQWVSVDYASFPGLVRTALAGPGCNDMFYQSDSSRFEHRNDVQGSHIYLRYLSRFRRVLESTRTTISPLTNLPR